MSAILQIGQEVIQGEDLYPLLAQHRLLPQLAREVLIDRAIADIDCSPEERELARQKFVQQYQLASEEQVRTWLQRQGMTLEQLENLMVRDLKLEKFKQATWGHQLEGYFLKAKSKLDRVVYSLIRNHDVGITQELYFRIQEGETSFAELARQYSQGSEAQTGGLIGPVELSVPHPSIAQLLSSSQPGQVCAPTRVGEWWVILRLEKYLPAQLDGPTRQRLLDELFQNWLGEQLQANVSFFPNAASDGQENPVR